MKNKICSRENLIKIIADLKTQDKHIAATSGCFDILHAGHVTYLEKAKSKGDILVVCLNSDKSVKTLKGNERPIICEKERALVIAALEAVDFVYIFDEQTPCSIYKAIKPDLIIKGGDYAGKTIPEMEIVKEYGGTVEYVDFVNGCSSTNIIEKIKSLVLSKDEAS
ncbi:MAG: D-glycero-beta-D-manno-heptose 1-phosphate adenylyltransferase [Treponema sp.]